MLAAGKMATREANNLLSLHEIYTFEVSGKDRYRRSICVVFLDDDSSFNDEMVKRGYAVPFFSFMNYSEKEHFENLLNAAKEMQVGLWLKKPKIMECLENDRRY